MGVEPKLILVHVIGRLPRLQHLNRLKDITCPSPRHLRAKTALACGPQPRHKLRSGAAAFWGQLVTKLGHTAKLAPPKYVKAYVERGATDAIDAAAISRR